MKYIISESRLQSAITNYFDEIFPKGNITWGHPMNDDGLEDDETLIEFWIGDWEDDDICFRWYSCEYFLPKSYASTICPTVSLEVPYENLLNGFFGELWHEPFKNWFNERFDLTVKTVDN